MAASSRFSPLLSTLLLLSFIHLFVYPCTEARNGGFSVDLFRRDSPKSPFHNPSSSHFQRLSNAFDRSISRAAYLKKASSPSSGTIQSEISSIDGEYLLKVSIGTPPVEILAIADTGSDVTWTQCMPCSECYEQNAPLFDPRKTSSYKQLSCQSSPCQALDSSSCENGNKCQYSLSYGDNSYSVGDLAVETFTFESTNGRPISIPKVVFGCGHDNDGTFNETGSGIIGLGGGSLSLVNQLIKPIGGKFSYCLLPFGSDSNLTSKFNFGRNSLLTGSQVVTTPLIKKTPDTFYYLNLEGISVGKTRLPYKKITSSEIKDSSDDGNIIIDSGTTLTFLPRDIYEDLESKLNNSIQAKPESDPLGQFGLCYHADRDMKFPKLVFHFTDADLELPSSSTFLEVAKGFICLTLIPADDIAILGNLSQMNFLIEYDLENLKLSFKPTDCTKH